MEQSQLQAPIIAWGVIYSVLPKQRFVLLYSGLALVTYCIYVCACVCINWA